MQTGVASFFILAALLGVFALLYMHGFSLQSLSGNPDLNRKTVAPVPGALIEKADQPLSTLRHLDILGHPEFLSHMQFFLKSDRDRDRNLASIYVPPSKMLSLDLPVGRYAVLVTYVQPDTSKVKSESEMVLIVSQSTSNQFMDLNSSHVTRIPFPVH